VFAYVTRRLLATIPLLIVATFIVFWMVSSVSNPLNRIAGNNAIDTPEERAAVEARFNEIYGLDTPIPVRYVRWLGDVTTGDLGISTEDVTPVSDTFWKEARNSAYIAVPAFVITAIVALVLGVYSAIRQYTIGDYTITGLSFIGLAFPTFFLGLLLQIFWNLWVPNWFGGWKPFVVFGMDDSSLWRLMQSAALPVMTLAIVSIAAESRFARASMLEVSNADYIRTARAKGLSERRVIFRHALRNAMIPVVTLWALDFAILLSGSVITETIFGWPGLGQRFTNALGSQNVDMMMAIVLFTAFLAVIFNLLADLLYGLLDPRVRYD
jgi:peptide/nickel transport system permease protein